MNYKPILVVAGEPNSIFLEIFFKSISLKKFKSPIILICSLKLLKLEKKFFKVKSKIKVLNINKLKNYKLDNKQINIIDIEYNALKLHSKITKDSNNYLKKSFSLAFELIKKKFTNKFINGPVSKKHFLNKKFPGITEYIASNFYVKNIGMLIYDKKLSVCPLTTHYPIKQVSKKITKKALEEKILLINNFYKNILNLNPKIGVTGLNPHCESLNSFNEDTEIIRPVINKLKYKINISGPFSADTIFVRNNRKKYNVILGMYHDQVLAPIKTIHEYNAINITMGLPFIRVSPDHGPNSKMLGKNKSSPKSLIRCFKFLDQI